MRMRFLKKMVIVVAIIMITKPAMSQTVADTALESKASEWVVSLKLTDDAKAQKVKSAIATHLTAVKDWHNSHPYTMIPEGINPTTGGKLSEMDRQLIICSTKPRSVHDNLMNILKDRTGFCSSRKRY
jgi:Tfp pilus assembly protein FimT